LIDVAVGLDIESTFTPRYTGQVKSVIQQPSLPQVRIRYA